jgi:hypothetical protein
VWTPVRFRSSAVSGAKTCSIQLRQHASEVVAKGANGVDGMGGRGTVAQAATLGFAVECHALAAAGTQLAGRAWVKHALDRRGHSDRIEACKQALNGGLVRGGVAPKAQGTTDVTGLAGGPFGGTYDCRPTAWRLAAPHV